MIKPLPVEVKQRVKELISLLERWNYEYFVLNQPSVPDGVYDQHFKELQQLENQYNFILPNSPTQKAGYEVNSRFQSVHRQIPMLSLNSVDNFQDLLKWEQRVRKTLLSEENINYVCEWKIDGLSISLIYRNHQLVQISTRGDGQIGEDVTFNKKLIKNIPQELKDIGQCEIRGEIYMKKGEFCHLNEELKIKGNKLLANPRNAAAGSLRTLIPLQNRSLHFFAYQLFNKNLTSQIECLQNLEKLGFAVSPDYQIFNSPEEIERFIQQQEKKRHSLDFESDGIVIKVNDYHHYQKLGQTSKFPRWAIAYKFPAVITTSRVKNIYTEVSRSGRVTYVASITPVILQGSRISNVTLHNYAFIRNLKLNIGDEIVIKKAGDVIPQVVQVIKLKEKDNWTPPSNCPSCHSLLGWNDTNIYQLCLNDNCPQKVINFLTHFASKNGLDIKGVSYKIIAKLYQQNLVKKPTDFYYLCQHRTEMLKLEGFQAKSVDNILTAIENSKKKSFANLLTALGIPLLSSVKARKLTNFYPALTNFLVALENEEWEKVRTILGEETQKEIKKYWQNPNNKKLLTELKLIVV